MSREESLKKIFEVLRKNADAGFYGTISVQFHGGNPIVMRKEETTVFQKIKPK